MTSVNVKFVHLRAKRNGTPLSRGGCTIAFVRDGEEVKMALSVCNSKQKYNATLGEKVAAERLLHGKALSLSIDDFAISVNNLNNKVGGSVLPSIDSLIKE